MPSRSEKPRFDGLTMVIDTGLGYKHTKDLLEICADYIDLWKLGWATTQLQPLDVIKKKIKLLRSKNISVSNGGTLLELSERQGKSEIFFNELVNIGCNATEISNGSVEISIKRMCELIQMSKKLGLEVYTEVGKKNPSDDLTVDEYHNQINEYLSAGSKKVIIEARESGAEVGVMDAKGIPNDNMVKDIIKDIDINNIIFESPRKNQQIYFLTNFGQDTNLGNIAPSDVISLETLRRGLRGDTLNHFYEVIGGRHLKNQKLD